MEEDIEVVFVLGKWEARGIFSQADVHRQVAIVFRTPAFQHTQIRQTVKVQMQLRRPSDKEVSETMEFQYLPDEADPHHIEEKRKRTLDSFKHYVKKNPFAGGETRPQRRIAVANRNVPTKSEPLTASIRPSMSVPNPGVPSLPFSMPVLKAENVASPLTLRSTVNISDFSNLGFSSQPPPQSDHERLESILNYPSFPNVDLVEMLPNETESRCTSLSSIDNSDFSQLLSESQTSGTLSAALQEPGTSQGTLMSYPQSIARLMTNRPNEDDGGERIDSGLINGIFDIQPGGESLASLFDLDISSLINNMK
ncbi:putative transcription factor p65 homolog [Xenopus laevis]|uniref:Rel homology dimerisation domain-containing protein n=2 Tax=Xenopus laevis TaxID=8355 RepID=A0A974CZV4_XENLA|nr:putative transcription factor p65 homolog [Xenopus laevis]OCT81672.1 hypothetical protein XELAEV_18024180mg [Xenopus laevis]